MTFLTVQNPPSWVCGVHRLEIPTPLLLFGLWEDYLRGTLSSTVILPNPCTVPKFWVKGSLGLRKVFLWPAILVPIEVSVLRKWGNDFLQTHHCYDIRWPRFPPGCPWNCWESSSAISPVFFVVLHPLQSPTPRGTLWQADSSIQLLALHSWFTVWLTFWLQSLGSLGGPNPSFPAPPRTRRFSMAQGSWVLSDRLHLFLLKVFNHMSVCSPKSPWIVDVPDASCKGAKTSYIDES